jgi:hypothetical protein
MSSPSSFVPVSIESSGVHGRGVFAKARVPQGVPVLTCGGTLVSVSPQDPLVRCMQVGPDLYLVEERESPRPDDFLNHSCQPNLGFLRGDLVLWSLREIEAGEELLIDYSTTINEPGWQIPCECGAATCRKAVRSFCDLDEHEQAALRPIALGYLLAKPNGE